MLRKNLNLKSFNRVNQMKIFQKAFVFLFFLFPLFSYAENSIDLIAEPNTYIPPFYEGRTSLIPEASVKVIAIPNIVIDGEKIDKGNIYFRWQVNGLFPDDNAFGKDYIIVNSRIPIKNMVVGVELLDSNMQSIMKNEITMKINQPEAIF